MSRSLRVHQECIEKVKQAVKRNGFLSQRALAEEAHMSLATVGSFLRGKPVDRAIFVELCDKLSLDCQEIAESIQAPPIMGEARQPASSLVPLPRPQDWEETTISWGEALDVSAFYGREAELALLKHWVGG